MTAVLLALEGGTIKAKTGSPTPRRPTAFFRKGPPPEKETPTLLAGVRDFSFRLVSLAVPSNAGRRRLDERFDTGPRIRWPGFESSLLLPVLDFFSVYTYIYISIYMECIPIYQPCFHRIYSSEREKLGPSISRAQPEKRTAPPDVTHQGPVGLGPYALSHFHH